MLSNLWVLLKVCGEPVSKKAYGDLDFGGKGMIFLGYYTINKTRPLLGDQEGVVTGAGSGHYCENVAAVVRWRVWRRLGISRQGGGY